MIGNQKIPIRMLPPLQIVPRPANARKGRRGDRVGREGREARRQYKMRNAKVSASRSMP